MHVRKKEEREKKEERNKGRKERRKKKANNRCQAFITSLGRPIDIWMDGQTIDTLNLCIQQTLLSKATTFDYICIVSMCVPWESNPQPLRC